MNCAACVEEVELWRVIAGHIADGDSASPHGLRRVRRAS
jgi:hypothetical protein